MASKKSKLCVSGGGSLRSKNTRVQDIYKRKAHDGTYFVDPLWVMLQLELEWNNGKTSAPKKSNMYVPALNSIHWCYRAHTPIPPLP